MQYGKLCVVNFTQQFFNLGVLCIDSSQPLMQAQDAKPQVLGGNQRAFFKQGNLDAAASYVHNHRALFQYPVKLLPFGGNGLVV